ncbi:MAG: ABC transporter substrate-binding protein [Prochlorococcaceae cyanobacterium]|jgi:multiple sugar transport system substrate-binding protein
MKAAAPLRTRWLRALLLVAVLVAGGLLRPSWARPPVAVNVLMPAPFADATAATVESFNRSHPGLRIQVTRGPFETESVSDLAISSLLLGDSPYDLLLMDVTWTAKYAAAGWLLPLEDRLDDPLAGVVLGAREGNWIEGHLWRVPMVASLGLLYWRTDLMEAPPRTPEELVRLSRELQRQGRVRWGFVWQGRQYEGLICDFLEVLHGFGGDWGPQVGPGLGLDSPEATAATAWLRRLVAEGISPPAVANFAEPETLQAFAAGDAAFMRNWPYAWQELRRPDSAVAGRVGVTTMVAETGRSPAATQGSWGLSVLSGSRHPAEAVEVLRYLSGEESQRSLVRDWGNTPTLEALFEDPALLAASPTLPEQRRALEHAVLRPITPAYAQLSDILQRRLSGAITGEAPAAAAMEAAARGSRKMLRASGAEKAAWPGKAAWPEKAAVPEGPR